jgi:hypothetical protein
LKKLVVPSHAHWQAVEVAPRDALAKRPDRDPDDPGNRARRGRVLVSFVQFCLPGYT